MPTCKTAVFLPQSIHSAGHLFKFSLGAEQFSWVASALFLGVLKLALQASNLVLPVCNGLVKAAVTFVVLADVGVGPVQVNSGVVQLTLETQDTFLGQTVHEGHNQNGSLSFHFQLLDFLRSYFVFFLLHDVALSRIELISVCIFLSCYKRNPTLVAI